MYDRQHLHLVWGGTLPGGEIWSNSLRMAASIKGDDLTNVLTWQQVEDWLHGDLKDKIAAWHSNSDAYINTNAKLTYAKINYVNMAGHYIDPNTHEHAFLPVVSGGSGSSPHPNQIAMVISLTTGLERGYAHRGRFYSPLPVGIIGSDGLIGQGQAQDVANAAAAFLTAVNDTPGIDIPYGENVCVMSSHGTGYTNVVTGVEVGRALDTQRRRRTELPESYASAPVSI